MNAQDLYSLRQLQSALASSVICDVDDGASHSELREWAYVVEKAIEELAEVEELRGIVRDALEDSVMYQRGVAEGLHRREKKG